MKSIIEEASSISKAIENAWKEAQKPLEFSVRIFELPQKNMFGFTTKSAKIGIFFEEGKKPQERSVSHQAAPAKERERNNQHKQQAPREQHKEQARPVVKPKKQETESRDPWNKEIVAFTQDWLRDLFGQLHINKQFSVSPDRYHLKINLNDTIFEQEEKNRALFRNCAYLLLQSMRNSFKRPFKGFKVILTVGNPS